MELNLLGLFALAFTAAVALPGPNVAFAVALVLRHGRGTALPGALGFALATALHAGAVLAGLGLLIQQHRHSLLYLRWAGALYLVYLAVHALRSSADPGASQAAPPAARRLFLDALLISLSNPKGWLASLLTYPAFIDPQRPYAPQALLLTLTAVAISLSIYGGYMLLAHRARAAFAKETQLNRLSAVIYLLVALGLVLLPH
ncbi:LysE family translocator [Pseudomonas sp. CBMAI 2609]|uniref:LysE family translocator n=1 Tax=Pseudomonas flavocrustae TaxID=2991719 RepID=A0ABT6IHY4_9PSED|nr:LysE family translocator [Pseudomonas sp. CBMAI 2609]MDH4764063.1 LysE family translocator [Pseudomonas sp. CBMAI 2609]